MLNFFIGFAFFEAGADEPPAEKPRTKPPAEHDR